MGINHVNNSAGNKECDNDFKIEIKWSFILASYVLFYLKRKLLYSC